LVNHPFFSLVSRGRKGRQKKEKRSTECCECAQAQQWCRPLRYQRMFRIRTAPPLISAFMLTAQPLRRSSLSLSLSRVPCDAAAPYLETSLTHSTIHRVFCLERNLDSHLIPCAAAQLSAPISLAALLTSHC
jgi:hypothetical protein